MLVVCTFSVALAAVVITLRMPNVYQASVRVLMPETGGGLSATMLKNLPSAASALLGGGGGGDYVRYLAILTSRTVQEAAVDSFDLVRVYNLEDSDHPREEALAMLRDRMAFNLDKEYEFLSVAASDTDPKRAAALANFLVRRLNETNAYLATQSANQYRLFVEQRYRQAQADMDSVLTAMQAFQQRYGVYDLPAQTQSFFDQIGDLRAKTLEAEIQYEALRDQYGAENPQVRAYQDIVLAANRKYQAALAGREQLLPVPQQDVPEVARRYAELEMERRIQTAIMEIIGPMYEQARLQEAQKTEAVQVLDHAVPPVFKSGPRRTVIVLAATLSAFLLACLFVLVFAWWHRNYARFAHRMQEAVAEPEREQSVTSR